MVAVDPAVFALFANGSTSRARQLEDLRQRLLDAHVGRSSFGIMPASGELFRAYTEQSDTCLDGLGGLATLMTALAEAAIRTKDNYEQVEAANAAMFGHP